MGIKVAVAVGSGACVGVAEGLGVLVGGTAVSITTTSAITAVADGVGSSSRVGSAFVQAVKLNNIARLATRMNLIIPKLYSELPKSSY